MEIGILLALAVLLVILNRLYKRITDWWHIRTRYPEYIRDRNKPLQVGQVWEEGPWKSIITAISGNQIEHEDYVPNWYAGDPQHTYHLQSTVKEFRKLIRFHKFHLAEQGSEHAVVETVKVKDLMEPPV